MHNIFPPRLLLCFSSLFVLVYAILPFTNFFKHAPLLVLFIHPHLYYFLLSKSIPIALCFFSYIYTTTRPVYSFLFISFSFGVRVVLRWMASLWSALIHPGRRASGSCLLFRAYSCLIPSLPPAAASSPLGGAKLQTRY